MSIKVHTDGNYLGIKTFREVKATELLHDRRDTAENLSISLHDGVRANASTSYNGRSQMCHNKGILRDRVGTHGRSFFTAPCPTFHLDRIISTDKTVLPSVD